MRLFCKALSILLVALLFAGCSETGYRYVERGDKSYLVLPESEQAGNHSVSSGAVIAPYVDFSTLSEMKTDILNGYFSEKELSEIARFDKNASGNVSVFSMNNFYAPKMPAGFYTQKIRWHGTVYSFFIREGAVSATLSVRSREQAERLVRYNFEELNCIDDHKKKEEFTRTEGDIHATGTAYYFNFTGSPGKLVNYTFTHEGIDYYVSESYESINGAYFMYGFEVVGISSENCFSITATCGEYKKTGAFISWPLEEIAQFGLKKYVETEIS